MLTKPLSLAQTSTLRPAQKQLRFFAQRRDLDDAIASLKRRSEARDAERSSADGTIQAAERRLASIVQPATVNGTAQLRRLNARRLELETGRKSGLVAFSRPSCLTK